MKNNFLKTSLRGALFLIPILGVGYLFYQLFIVLGDISDKIIENTPLNKHWQVFVAIVISIIALLFITYIAGRISKSKAVVKLSKSIDEELLSLSPAYRKFKISLDNQARFLVENRPPIFVRFGDKERPGFLIDSHNHLGRAVVFIPKNFNNYDGNVYVVDEKDIRYAKSNSQDFIYALDHVGDGLDIS